jgi:hypothetical protein
LQNAATVAERISANDLQIAIQPKSPADLLNHSLQIMVTKLQAMTTANQQAMLNIQQQNQAIQQENWRKDGLNQLSLQVTTGTTLAEMCQQALNFVARYVNAGVGVLYVYAPETAQLTRTAAFALTDAAASAPTCQLGEGTIGQVARDRKPLRLQYPGPQEGLITTGTFSGSPLDLYLFPLLYEQELTGVLELGSFELFEGISVEFLNDATRIIATAISVMQQRERVQVLLRQSQAAMAAAEEAKADAQRQAEDARRANVLLEEQQQELAQQSEELRQMNTRLEEREQELRQQQEELRQQNDSLKRSR